MRYQKLRHRFLAGIMTAMLVLGTGAGISAVKVQAASGTVYSCSITSSYTHPVTGEIEDAGGQASYVTGQGMVEGAVASAGIMEVTDSGEYYLTFRMSLMDYTNNHSFAVQKTGDAGWSAATAEMTAQGSDNNGTTADIRIQVPGSDCILRVSMYVSPMGRDVIFYLYPGNYSEGNSSDMTAAIVTEPSGSDAASGDNSSAENSPAGDEQGSADSGKAGEENSLADSGKTGEENGSIDSGKEGEASSLGSEEKETGTSAASGNQKDAEKTSAKDQSGTETASGLTAAQGLSLSTALETAGEENVVSGAVADTGNELSEENNGKTVSISAGTWILVFTISFTVSGLILLAAGAGVVYYFRKNWDRWGGDEDED